MWLLGIVTLCVASVAHAQTVSHAVTLEGPDAVVDLLHKHLKIVNWRDGHATSPRLFRSIYRATPAEIKALLATEGYFTPAITPTLHREKATLRAHFEIDPGRRTHVGNVELQFTGDISQQSATLSPTMTELQKSWSLPAGAVFRQADWDQAKTRLLRAVLADRYPTARFLKTEARVDSTQALVTLTLIVDSGPLVTLGNLEISGLERYNADMIRNMNVLQPGEPYSQSKLLALQEKLQNTLYFSYVAVNVEARRDQPRNVPIRISVTEALSRRLGLGVGMNTDTGLRGQIEYNDYNVLNRGWRFSSVLRTETARQLVNGAFDFPVTRDGFRYGVNAALLRTTLQELDTTTLSVGGRRSSVVGDIEKSIGIEYLWEHINAGGVQQSDNAALYPSVVWSKRRFDNLLDPTHGYAMTLQVGGGLQSVLSRQDFLRMYGKWIGYFSPWLNDQVILRAEMGAILAESQAGIPTVLLFRTGGDQSVRGYAFQSLGLKRGEAVLGARYMGVASLEYVHWLSPRWGAAAFCDFGDAFDNVRDANVNLGFGAGARWRSPVGPVYLDLAYGEASKQVRVHFALGIRF